MVERQLRHRGIADPRVLEAMAGVPREAFLPPRSRPLAYRDRALPLAEGQTMSQPFMVAAMTEALELGPADRVLEVGTGSGYQAAVLSRLAARVFSVERLAGLADEARRRLGELGVTNVVVRTGDGTLGWPEEAPFERIIVAAGAPVGSRSLQRLVVLERQGARYRRTERLQCRFVPLLGAHGWGGPPSGS
jgi:protein-L-isoaspartate(D-aspartate) O-methyltransferase